MPIGAQKWSKYYCYNYYKKMAEFRGYGSIENMGGRMVDSFRMNGYCGDEEWVALEKVDGANFIFGCGVCDGVVGNMWVGRRRGILKEGDSLYNYKSVVEKYGDRVQKMLSGYAREKGVVNGGLYLYGELFGGWFNGKSESGAKRIQKKVEYAPWNDFIVFDMAVRLSENGEKNEYYMDHDDLVELCKKYGVRVLESICRGTFDEVCEKLGKVCFESTIPGLLGVDGHESLEGNIAEGCVLKPVKYGRYMGKGWNRVILKWKNEGFMEKASSCNREKEVKVEKVMSESAKVHVEGLRGYLTENRISNVYTKLTDEEKIDLGMVCNVLWGDALKDYEKDLRVNEKLGDDEKLFKSKADRVAVRKALFGEYMRALKEYIRESEMVDFSPRSMSDRRKGVSE